MPQASTTGESAVLARRYASAFYQLAEEQKALDAAAADLRLLKSIAQENNEFHHIAFNPRLTRAQLVKAAQKITATAKLNPLTGNFLGLIAQKRRLKLLGAMIDSFLNELAMRRGEFTAEVRAAHKLTPAQQEELASQLRALAGGKVHLIVNEDKSLLGGLTVKMGSRLIDASVKSKLARLERQLKSRMEAA